jgi:hypothetical protein
MFDIVNTVHFHLIIHFCYFYQKLTSLDRQQDGIVGTWKRLGNLQRGEKIKIPIIAILIPHINYPIYLYNKEYCKVLTSFTEGGISSGIYVRLAVTSRVCPR